MGLEFVRTLSSDELRDMAGNTLPRDIGRSFRNADLVIEATDGTDTRYIVMEVSFTADRRDCDRAIRNAGLITRFTGKPAQAAVASVRNDREAAVESGGGVLAPAGGQDAYSRVSLGPSPRLAPEHMEYNWSLAQEQRQKAKELGKCRISPNPAIPGQTRCSDCAEHHRQSRRRSDAGRRAVGK